jgi:hypothetical protein
MPHYRCYFLARDNRIIAVTEESHADDPAAIGWADTLLERCDSPYCTGIELWGDAHCVHGRERDDTRKQR